MYVSISLLSWTNKNGLNGLRLLSVLQQNEGDEFIAYFPHYAKDYEEVPHFDFILNHKLRTKYNRVATRLETYFISVKDIQEEREFHTQVQQTVPADYQGYVLG